MPLKVHAQVPYGNVSDLVVRDAPGATEIEFSPSTHGGPECLWFCFRVLREGALGAPARLTLILKHADTILGGEHLGNLRPVVKYSGRDWERLAPPDVRALPDGRPLVSWSVDAPPTSLDVAFCYPYGRPELDSLVADSAGFWKSDVIGLSQSDRPILRLSNSPGAPGSTRPGLYLLSRQHAGETPGSWVLDGFLRRLASAGPDAPLVWSVPLANIDAIEQGDYGKDNFPYDLNRSWDAPSMRHEVMVMMIDILRWSERCRPVLALDLHAPGADDVSGVFTFLSKSETRPEMPLWCRAFHDALAPDYAAADFARDVKYRARWNTPLFGDFCANRLRIPALSFEIPYAMCGPRLLSRDDYRQIGSRMASAVLKKLAAVSE